MTYAQIEKHEEKFLVLKCGICGEIFEDEFDAEQHVIDEHWDPDDPDGPDNEELEEWIEENMTALFLTKEELQKLRDEK